MFFWAVLLSFVFSCAAAKLIIATNKLHLKWSSDFDLDGVQKFHALPVPRVGGIAVVSGFVAAGVLWLCAGSSLTREFWLLFLCASPAFVGGVVEDLTKKVSALNRLILTMLSALLGAWLLGANLSSVDVAWADVLLSWLPFSLVFTCFAVAGVANSINLIDGFNGLASMVCILAFLAISFVGFSVGDMFVGGVALVMAGAMLGFWVWNYPFGKVFLGDGGAYFSGFMIAELSVLLLARNPQVSAWFPFLVVIYPVFETVFTIYRRVVVRRVSPGLPDAVHMHQMVYMRLVRCGVGSKSSKSKTVRNSLTAPYLWVLCSLAVFPAVIFWHDQLVLQLFSLFFAVVYVLVYRMIAKFKVPKFLIFSHRGLGRR